MNIRIILLLVTAQLAGLYSLGQSSNNGQLFERVVEDNKSPQVAKALLLDNYMDGTNHTWDVNTQLTLTALLSKAFPVLDSVGAKLSKADKSALLASAQKYHAGKSVLLKNADLTTINSQEFGNLQANMMVVSGDATPEQVAALRERRIEKIKESTPAEKANIFQLSEPFFYNNHKNAFLLLLIIEPGSNNFYVCNYSLKDSKWSKANQRKLVYYEKN